MRSPSPSVAACISLAASLLLLACAESPPQSLTFVSPDGTLGVEVTLDSAGAAYYALRDPASGRAYVLPSRLGIIAEEHAMTDGLTFSTVREDNGRASYTLTSGKQLAVDKPYVSRTVYFNDEEFVDLGRGGIEFRLFDDGLAFRYVLSSGEFRTEDGGGPTVTRELTSFVLPEGLTAIRQDYAEANQYGPAYELYWDLLPADAPDTAGRGLALPLYAYDSARHVMLHEANVRDDFYGSHLAKLDGSAYGLRGPLPAEAMGLYDTAATVTSGYSPWRIIVAGPTRQTVVASTLVTDVADAQVDGDFSWVRPGRATWSWWSDWDSPKDYAKLERFVDWTADNAWDYTLVDANWNEMTGGSLEGLAAYAKTRDVPLLVWYNSGGPHNEVTEQPRDIMSDAAARRAEMARLQSMGIAGVKVDFFQSDKQAIMSQYVDILEDAAAHELLVNFHGCTVPRGLRRTYPHLLTAEAVVGAESYEFKADYPARTPAQHTLLPLARNVVGPMDYTPVALTDRAYPRLTTDAHELALAVLFESGLLHFADDVAAYDALPAFAKTFLDEVPVTWDETRYVDGVPGEWIVMARRKGRTWYLAAINGTDAPREVGMDFMDPLPGTELGIGSVMVVTDGASLLFGEDPIDPEDRLVRFRSEDGIRLTVPAYGGFVAFTR